jgi:signal transduction histidine kinase
MNLSFHPRIQVTWAVFIFLGEMLCSASFAEPPAPPLPRIQDIRILSREEATKAIPVRISGTCIHSAFGDLVVHDGTHGIWVSSYTSLKRGLLRDQSAFDLVRVGMAVEIEGIVDPGGYAPQILPLAIRQTGNAELPPPRRISAEQWIAGSEDGQRVEVIGVVQKVEIHENWTVCAMVVEGVNCWFTLLGDARNNLAPLVDARVRAIGVFAPDFNNRSEAVAPKIVSSSPDCIQILIPPHADPFDSPRIPLAHLRAFSPDVSLFHRKVTSGIVTFVQPGRFFFLRDGDASVRVSSEATDLRPGWRVDVAGFVDTTHHFAAIKDGIIRKTGETLPPPTQTITAGALLKAASRSILVNPNPSNLSGRGITLRGRIRRVDWTSPLSPVAVWLEADDVLFPAHLPPGTGLSARQAASWQLDAEAELTGTCELEFHGRPDPLGLYDPIGFHLWLASPADLVIVHPAPWWTPQRLSIALSVTGLVAMVGMLGVASLRRQVKRQIALTARELENNAIASERERMARDLHDTLEQQLTGVAMQLESLAKSPQSQSPVFSDRLALASRMIQHSREEARRSVWDLRNRLLENHGLAAALQSLAASAAIDGGPAVETRIEESPDTLQPAIAYQLLRMAQEAVANSLKHARAGKIHITLEMAGHHLVLSVSDDGLGFDSFLLNPPGPPHFGLIGMRERASKIGATLDIVSQPGNGCTVTITLPVPAP